MRDFSERFEEVVEDTIQSVEDRDCWGEVASNLADEVDVDEAIQGAIEDGKAEAEMLQDRILNFVHAKLDAAFEDGCAELDDEVDSANEVATDDRVQAAVRRVYSETEAALDQMIDARAHMGASASQDRAEISFSVSLDTSWSFEEHMFRDVRARLFELRTTVQLVADEICDRAWPKRLDRALARLREAVLASTYRTDDVKYVEGLVDAFVTEIKLRDARHHELRTGNVARICAYCGQVWPCDGSAYQAPEVRDMHRPVPGETTPPSDDAVEAPSEPAAEAPSEPAAEAATVDDEAAVLAQFNADEASVLRLRQNAVDLATTDEERFNALASLAKSRATWAHIRAARFGGKEG